MWLYLDNILKMFKGIVKTEKEGPCWTYRASDKACISCWKLAKIKSYLTNLRSNVSTSLRIIIMSTFSELHLHILMFLHSSKTVLAKSLSYFILNNLHSGNFLSFVTKALRIETNYDNGCFCRTGLKFLECVLFFLFLGIEVFLIKYYCFFLADLQYC